MTKVDSWGNSLAVRIPKTIAQTAHLQKGTTVVIKAVKDGLLISRTSIPRPARRKRKYSLRQLLSRCKGPNPYKYVGDHAAVGKEIL